MSLDSEQITFSIILHAGDARSHAMEAIQKAKVGDMLGAEASIAAAEEALNKAHQSQTDLIQSEARGEKNEITILLIHAQDHLMTAMVVKDLAKEFIELYQKSFD